MRDCEKSVLDFVREHTPAGKCPLAGSSVGQDVKFLDRLMPELMEHMHYRIVDVSTIKECLKRWNPEVMIGAPKKAMNHRALDDIRESIGELKYYKEAAFK
jgi:oligoribonuclease